MSGMETRRGGGVNKGKQPAGTEAGGSQPPGGQPTGDENNPHVAHVNSNRIAVYHSSALRASLFLIHLTLSLRTGN